MSGVEVVEHSPRWADDFEAVAAVLSEALADVRSAVVEHVGSTSVPGLAAKPILDVDVIVEPADVAAAVAALERPAAAGREAGGLAARGRERGRFFGDRLCNAWRRLCECREPCRGE